MKRTLLTFVIAIAIVLLFRTFVLTSCTIPHSGMENTLYQGDHVIVNKWSYGLRLPLTSVWGYHRWGSKEVNQGDIILFNNPAPTNPKQTIEARDLYISRCIGKAGDTLMLNNELVKTGNMVISPDDKYLYSYPGEHEDLILKVLEKTGLSDNKLLAYNKGDYLRSFSHYELYLIKQELGGTVHFKALQNNSEEGVHPFVVPSRGQLIKVYPWNAKLLCNTINLHEGRTATLRGNTLVVDGTPVAGFRFTKNYYWVASANSINVTDSRLFGFVPEDHLIGRASLVWFSKDCEQRWNEGFRWERFFLRL